jgi:hypothetical protein
MAKKPDKAPGPDWTNVQNVFKHLKALNGGRPLTPAEKELILGQRRINRRFFDAITAILDVVSASPSESAKAKRVHKDTLTNLKKDFQTLPGERPPGCPGNGEIEKG